LSDPVKVGLVATSDRASQGVYRDEGIPALEKWLAAALLNPIEFERRLIPDERAAIEEVLERHPGVVEVTELLTLVLGPRALLVAARLDLVDSLTAAEVERVCSELDHAIGERVPDATEVFLDATPGRR